MREMHAVADVVCDGFPGLQLRSPAGLAASYVPGAGMVCCSLTHRGEELLGQRGGLRAYASDGSTMGIPLLHPWANRLSRWGYAFEGVTVELPPDAPQLHDDGNGLPIHGLLAGCPHWQVIGRAADADSARIEARLDIGAHRDLVALFPFPHEIEIAVALRHTSLAIATTVRATGDVPVPIAFGYHPYFRLPNVPRAEWEVALPVRRRMRLDSRYLPTGETEAVDLRPAPLGDGTYDDLFVELAPEPTFRLSGGGRSISVSFGTGYRVAVVYAPADDDVVCFEPMTAPTDPFARGGPSTRVQPGASFTASFRVDVD